MSEFHPQYALDLALEPARDAGGFFVSASNRAAHDWLMRWPAGDEAASHASIVHGPPGCGKTALGRGWAARMGARILAPGALETQSLPDMLAGAQAAWLDDAERVGDATTLFHLLNYAKEQGIKLLITLHADRPASLWPLPDLASRLAALPSFAVEAPDDALLLALLQKHFADRQLRIGQDVVFYLLPFLC